MMIPVKQCMLTCAAPGGETITFMIRGAAEDIGPDLERIQGFAMGDEHAEFLRRAAEVEGDAFGIFDGFTSYHTRCYRHGRGAGIYVHDGDIRRIFEQCLHFKEHSEEHRPPLTVMNTVGAQGRELVGYRREMACTVLEGDMRDESYRIGKYSQDCPLHRQPIDITSEDERPVVLDISHDSEAHNYYLLIPVIEALTTGAAMQRLDGPEEIPDDAHRVNVAVPYEACGMVCAPDLVSRALLEDYHSRVSPMGGGPDGMTGFILLLPDQSQDSRPRGGYGGPGGRN